MADNITAFRNGMKKARDMVMRKVSDKLFEAGQKLIQVAWDDKKFLGFTGNTQTSIAIGVYVDGHLTAYQTGLKNQQAPIRKKIQYNQRVFLNHPYEGNPRGIQGQVILTEEFGIDSSMRFLMYYRPKVIKGVGLVMVVGTEYAEFINGGVLGPLTSAYNAAPNIVWQTIEKGLKE